MPEIISVDNKVYYLQYSDSFTGDVSMITDNEPFYSLASALNKNFSHSELNYQHCLLTVACNTVAISMISEGKFKIFDSHSRDLYGMPDSGGKCVLLDVEGLDNLLLYFQSSYGYMFPRDTALLFEVKAVKLSNSSTGIIQNNNLTLMDNNECVSENTNELNKNVYPSQKGKQNESLEERERHLMMRRQKYKERKQKESAESREERLMKLRDRRKNQSLETRLSGRRQRAKQAIINESGESRAKRLSVKREKAKQAINNESGESREKRLSQKREKAKQEFNNNKSAEHKQTKKTGL